MIINFNHRIFGRFLMGVCLIVVGAFVLEGGVAWAAKTKSPYFAALKADKVHVRKGPGRKYGIVWTYRSLGLPVEVTARHEHWRRIRDSTGAEGWVYFRLLTGLRMALVSPWEKQSEKSKKAISLHQSADLDAPAVVNLESDVKVLVKSCTGTWCFVSISNFKGWIEQKKLWGVYQGEVFE